MPKTNFTYTEIPGSRKNEVLISLSNRGFKSFNSSILGLGDISEEGEYVQALAAIFDLEGFTPFSNQVDSHLVIPEFLKRYIDWLFISLAEEFKHGEKANRITLWADLPIFTKFLGDGLLLLWDTSDTSPTVIYNIVGSLYQIIIRYQTEFLPLMKKHVSNPPSKLRCGVARGQIITIGEGNDFVGPCINIASRLQKLSQLTFAISRRGFDLSEVSQHISYFQQFILKKVNIRGVGSEELVYVHKKEFRQLPLAERKLFENP
jgi:class 3 adenylate cyclase